LELQIDRLKHENNKNLQTIQEVDAKVETMQLNSMEDLNLKLHEIKKAVCYNFLVDMVAKHIIVNNGKTDYQIKLSIDEIFEKYKTFRTANRYQDPIYDESYEKSIITKAFNNIDGIKNTYITVDGVQSRAKLFHVDKITEWICENIQVPKRFRNIFREISKTVVFAPKYCQILNKNITEFKYVSTYSFLIHLLIKYKNNELLLVIKNTIITEEYLKFMLQFDNPKLTTTGLLEILVTIPGISRRTIRDNGQTIKGLKIDTKEVITWINDTLEIPDEFSKILLI
jgi:hypothetical protein